MLEAHRLEIPVIALADTNCDPDEMDYPIPANDDAIRAVRLLCAKIADAVMEGRRQLEAAHKDREQPEGEEVESTQVATSAETVPFTVEAAEQEVPAPVVESQDKAEIIAEPELATKDAH